MTPRRVTLLAGLALTLWILGGWFYLWPYYAKFAGAIFLSSVTFKETEE